jgi:glycogen debranching enzyme
MIITGECYTQALKTLRSCISEIGFKASAFAGGYHEVWARDSMITSLGALSTDEDDLIRASKDSLITLKKYQTNLGLIPNNVDVKNREPQFRAYMDGTMWYIIGLLAYYKRTKDKAFLISCENSVKKALSWIAHQDVDNYGLISTQEATNWMDLFPVRGKTLYDNVLHYQSLVASAEIFDILQADPVVSKKITSRAQIVREKINDSFWVYSTYDSVHEDLQRKISQLRGHIKNMRLMEDESLYSSQRLVSIVRKPYFLAYIGFRNHGEWFDLLGNSLAILYEVASKEQGKSILNFTQQVGADQPFPGKAIYPPIHPGDSDWRDYFRHCNLNLPEQYHNGGIWPFIGGFYTAALAKVGNIQEARSALQKLAEANYRGKAKEWEFNEWLHGQTGNPMGMEHQAWSAAMYIFAYNYVNKVDLTVDLTRR